ncbi:hypothetical protein FLA_3141 [Filimonas lacunae]|nr:hypothetical protein FLA_3141 [Filimonas lacunae]
MAQIQDVKDFFITQGNAPEYFFFFIWRINRQSRQVLMV